MEHPVHAGTGRQEGLASRVKTAEPFPEFGVGGDRQQDDSTSFVGMVNRSVFAIAIDKRS